MKKLIVAVVIVCAAAFVQAGAVKWECFGVEAPDAGTAYLFNSATVESTTIDTIIAAISDGTFASTYASKAAYTLDFEDGEFSQSNAITGITGSTDLWMVAVDNASDPTKAFVGEEQNFTIGSSGYKTYTWDYNDTTTAWTPVGGSPVPEPTSGLLMLLGMAGLALRRRRA